MFDGPPTPAVGFGMGDVVLTLVLADKGLIPGRIAPAADVYVLAAEESARSRIVPLVSELRTAGLHVRFPYRGTTNVGKLLKEADQCGARYAVILDGRAAAEGIASVKDLRGGTQTDVPIRELLTHVRGPGA
jgi:histidyl-tRNA synthetase